MNHYRTLEVATNASQGVVQAAYRELAKQHKDDDAYMKRLNAAKEVLLDESRREKYDEGLAPGAGGVLGNYKILKVIAEGGFGRTYLAEHTVLGTKVCIKHAHRISAEDEALLHEEAKIIWDLRHYGIPNLRDTLKLDDGSVALVMSYIPGPTLAEVLEKHPKGLDAEHVAWITERIINILKYLHYHAVVHGDVKPQNVIVEPEKHMVTLVDYGLSAIRPRKDSANKGYTPYFAAPEQIQGKTLLPEADFYGLGMTMIFALGGDVQAKAVPSHTPDHMCAFIKRLISYNIHGRPRWEDEDIHESFQRIREKDFGRRTSNMKPLKV
jgi:serine/threonine protein kinase